MLRFHIFRSQPKQPPPFNMIFHLHHIRSSSLTPPISIIITLFIALIYVICFLGEKFFPTSISFSSTSFHIDDNCHTVRPFCGRSVYQSENVLLDQFHFLCDLAFCVYVLGCVLCSSVLSLSLFRLFSEHFRFLLDFGLIFFLCSLIR